MKLSILVDMEPTETVAIKKTMNRTSMGTTEYSVSEACYTYLRMIQQDDGNEKRAKEFVGGLVKLE